MTQRRVAVVFLEYLPTHEFKDQGMYIRALRKAGYDAFLVTADKPELANYASADYEVVRVHQEDVLSGGIWDALAVDAVIGINWFSRHFLSAAQDLCRRNIPLVIKADTDGFASPRLWLRESLRRYLHQSRDGHLNLGAAGKIIGRALIPGPFDRRLLAVVECSAAVIVETTAALANVQRFVVYYGRHDLMDRLQLVCNPVDSVFTDAPSEPRKKAQVILIGRWDDYQKNTRIAIRAVYQFLETQRHYTAIVTGTGTDKWRLAQRRYAQDLNHRVSIYEHLPHRTLMDILAQSQMLLSASFFEGSPLAMAEALCCGTTVVGTPIPATDHFIENGRFGTRAVGFHWRGLVEALREEALRWDLGTRDPASISNYWVAKLRYESISKQLQGILEARWFRPS